MNRPPSKHRFGPVVLLASLLLGVDAGVGCGPGDAGSPGDTPGAGGTGGEGGTGGQGGMGGSGGDEETGGSGGGGGPGGSGGAGGAGGSGGEGGEGGSCPVGEFAECGPLGSDLQIEIAELWGVFVYVNGVADFDFPGFVVSHQHGSLEGERILTVEDAGGVRVSLRYVTTEQLAVPAVPGDELILHYDAFYDSIAQRSAHRQTAWIEDVAGRDLWAMSLQQNTTMPPFISGLSVVSSAPRCAAPVDTGFGEADYLGYDLEVRFRGGPLTPAPLGEVTAVEGADAAGLLQVARFFHLPDPCHDGEYPRRSLQTAWVATELAPAGAACVLDSECGEDAYCERAAGACDSLGHCRPRPDACPGALRVCACDGNVYYGACEANRAGVDIGADPPDCEGHYPCGIFACAEGEEACTRNLHGAIPQCLKWSFFACEAADCSCVDGRGIWEGCTCTETAPGRFEVDCE